MMMEIDLFEIFKAFPVCVTVLVPYGRYILLCLIRWAIQGICLTSCALIKGKISQFDREIQLENEVKYLSL